MDRRSFLRGFGAVLAAPAIVKVTSIMPVKVLSAYEILPYKGVSYMDSGMFYCPYVPLQIVDIYNVQRYLPPRGRIFETRYGVYVDPTGDLLTVGG